MTRAWKVGLGSAALLLVMKACTVSGLPVWGTVLDETTGKPVPGAIVVVRWGGKQTNFFTSSNSLCLHVAAARADAQGRYFVSGWWHPAGVGVSGGNVSAEAFKPGYTRPKTLPDEIRPWHRPVLIRPFVGTKDDYFAQLDLVVPVRCGGRNGSVANLYPVYAAVADHARELAHSSAQREWVRDLEYRQEELLVNTNRPVRNDNRTGFVNVDPADAYPKRSLQE